MKLFTICMIWKCQQKSFTKDIFLIIQLVRLVRFPFYETIALYIIRILYKTCTCTPYKNRCNCRCTVTFPFSPFAQEGDQIRVSYSHRIYRRFFLSPESFLTFYLDSGRVNESLQCPVIV